MTDSIDDYRTRIIRLEIELQKISEAMKKTGQAADQVSAAMHTFNKNRCKKCRKLEHDGSCSWNRVWQLLKRIL